MSRVVERINPMKKMWMILALAMCIATCGRKDPPDEYQLGSPLTEDLIGSCEQFLICNTPLVLMMNPDHDIERYDPYLLVFDQDHRLAAASYFPSERIDRIEGDTIHCRLNHTRKNRYRQRQRGEIEPFVLAYDTIHYRILRKSSFLIEQFTVQEADCNAVLVGRTASDPFSGLEWVGKRPEPRMLHDFEVEDTISINLSELVFDRSEGIITRFLSSEGKNLWFDDMIVSSDSLWEVIFAQIWELCEEAND